jgi:rubrerythrin
MALTKLFTKGWRRLLDAIQPDERKRLIEFLRQEYVSEARDVAQFREHAKRMTYPQFRERLLRIAEEENAHVEWLRKQILNLGGAIPENPLPVKEGRNPWENLRIDAEEEQRDSIEVLYQIYAVAERINPQIAEGLRRLYEEEKRHRGEFLDMLMRTDPQAFETTTAGTQSEPKK